MNENHKKNKIERKVRRYRKAVDAWYASKEAGYKLQLELVGIDVEEFYKCIGEDEIESYWANNTQEIISHFYWKCLFDDRWSTDHPYPNNYPTP